jgi:superfamily I DNA/RNA helicase/mRNA-degrading endonuclease RelE of RelBE toxin-antitoxin system
MTYLITQKPSFLADFVSLSKDVQTDVVKAIEQLTVHAENYHLGSVKKLDGFRNVWRYRIGSHRLIYSVAGRVVQLLAVGARGRIYERFGVNGDIPDAQVIERVEAALEPERNPTYVTAPIVVTKARPLPFQLTSDLLHQWLIPADYHASLVNCKSEDDLLIVDIPSEHVERVLDCLFPREAERIVQQPTLVLHTPEDLLKYADGDLIGFLLRLDADQEKLVAWSLQGPTLIKGGPGSGKSTVALYRTAGLFSRTERTQPRVLFTTYTTTLATVSEQLLERLLGGKLPHNLDITNVDKLVMKLASRYLGRRVSIATPDEVMTALVNAREATSITARNSLERAFLERVTRSLSNVYLMEEFEWIIEGQNCSSEQEYQKAERTGRGYAFNEPVRHVVWEIYGQYLRNLEALGKTTFSKLRLSALEAVRNGYSDEKYDYVIVDEAQDLSPSALALCVELCKNPAGIFITADSSQSLYNRGFRWNRVHSDLKVTGRTRLLSRNYRSTHQISIAAAELVADKNVADAEAVHQECIFQGEKPKISGYETDIEQVKWLSEQILVAARALRLPIGATAVLTAHNSTAEYIANLLKQTGIPARYMMSREVDVRSPEVKVITMHAAKGLEFPIVALPFLSDDLIPGAVKEQDESVAEEHYSSAKRLLYVACTRAMRHLILSYPQQSPSRFLRLLSRENWEWVSS